MAKLKVTMVRGFAQRTERQRATLRGLGLKKRHQTVSVEDNPSTRGMIEKVSHLIEVEEVKE